MKRRQFITLLGGAAATWPIAVRGQQRAVPLIGFLGSESPELFAARLRSFRQALGETGYVEGRSVAIEYRWAGGEDDRLPALATDLVRRQVALIVAPGSTPTALAAKAATITIPIVFAIGADPVAVGLVASLNRPGGNLTGVTSLNVELGPKRLELLHELVPTASSIALLVNSPNLNAQIDSSVQAAARTLGLQLYPLSVSTERDFDAVLSSLMRLQVGGLIISPDPLFVSRSTQLAALTVRYGVPAISQFREFASAGGLMTYGGSTEDSWRQVGLYTGRILNGERPADLPVQQVTKVELIINLKTARALDLTIPPGLLARADEVIE